MNDVWYTETVMHGTQHGRTIGFPTINLSPQQLENNIQQGIYTCLVKHKKTLYKGVLFYGPRLVKKEKHTVLEIFIIDFDQEIYNQDIEFKPLKFIRPVKHFDSMDDLKKEIEKDVQIAKSMI